MQISQSDCSIHIKLNYFSFNHDKQYNIEVAILDLKWVIKAKHIQVS